MSGEQALPVEEGVLEDRLERRIDPNLRLDADVQKCLQLMALDFAEVCVLFVWAVGKGSRVFPSRRCCKAVWI